MLSDKLDNIIDILDELIEITEQDLVDIQDAKHQELFNRNSIKESLLSQFNDLKLEIDKELQNRAKTKDISELLNVDENLKLEEFKKRLIEFNSLHRKLSKLVLSVSSFYNDLWKRVTGEDDEYGK